MLYGCFRPEADVASTSGSNGTMSGESLSSTRSAFPASPRPPLGTRLGIMVF
jgi:hypothetical protein